MTDLDDTSACPVGHRCESCGTDAGELAIATAALGRLGVACLTLCAACAESGLTPHVAVGTAVRLVGQHCQHLGIDLDEMAELMRDQPS